MFYASSVALRKNKSRIYNESKRRKCDWIYQKRVQEIVAVFTSNQEERVAMKTAMKLPLLALTVRWWRLELGHDSWVMSTNKKERHIVLPHGHGSEMSALGKKREFLSQYQQKGQGHNFFHVYGSEMSTMRFSKNNKFNTSLLSKQWNL